MLQPIESDAEDARPKRTIIGVLASHDDPTPNENLISVFTYLFDHANKQRFDKFYFAITGGTWDRIFRGSKELRVSALRDDVAEWLYERAMTLPTTHDGGVIYLSYLISQQQCSIVWPFYAPNANHWQRHENLAFIRLCDQWHVKRLMNRGSVMAWFDNEADLDGNRNLQPCPPNLTLARLTDPAESFAFEKRAIAPKFTLTASEIKALRPESRSLSEMRIALIAHDEMKARMIEFAIDHEAELAKFGTILATGTTGREVAAATTKRIDKKMIRLHSGPKGGDIEIATAILCGRCDVVIFFVDPLKPHPHIEDIRVVFQACMIMDQVVMITNEMHAREFMSRVVREHDEVRLYK